MQSFPNHVLLAADSVRQLRRCDVFRLIDCADQAFRQDFAEWLVLQRPDLAAEVAECLEEFPEKPKTWFVVSSYAGGLQSAWVRGTYGDKAFAQKQRDHMEKLLGVHAVVRVFDADQIPQDVTIYV